MISYSPSFVFGVIVLAYLSSFVLFAVLRIVTGVSIQRIGYFSLRRIAYTPKDGIKLELRGLGLVLHRPTFAQPTWLSVVLTEPKIIIDLKEMGGDPEGDGIMNGDADNGADGPSCAYEPKSPDQRGIKLNTEPSRSQIWNRMTNVKERIKRLHKKINWLRMVDVVMTNAILDIADIASIQIGSFTMAVDTRRKTVDRGRIFQHKRAIKSDQRPAEWIITCRGILFTPEGKDSLEILDHATLNIHGLLYKELNGLRDAAVALKLGRVNIPYDDFLVCHRRYRSCRRYYKHGEDGEHPPEVSLADVMEELRMPGTRAERIVQAVQDSKEFASSILRGIQEVQFAVSFLAVTKEISTFRATNSPLYWNLSMKEVGVDLHRLDQSSPAHRMYFSPKDVAHQALLAAISISISLDDGQGEPERIIYVPMVTMTLKTTLPSKTLQFSEDKDAAERNANILSANMVITSPSVDLDPKHLSFIIAVSQGNSKVPAATAEGNHHIISRLLPKATIRLTIHEPVVRIVLPPMEKHDNDDYDLLISSISSISLDVESSHSAGGELHYSLASNFRIASHQLYYQTASGTRYDLLLTKALDVKVEVSVSPEVLVAVNGNLQTFSVHMIRPEISQGIRQIFLQIKNSMKTREHDKVSKSQTPNFLRKMPPWLQHVRLEGKDFGVEVAGVYREISKSTQGIALQLETWTAEYHAVKTETHKKHPARRRANSKSLTQDESLLQVPPRGTPYHRAQKNPTDGRRMAVHIHGLEGFIVESMDTWEPEPFLALPRFEIAFSTSSDSQGPIFHVNSHIRTLSINYSLYRHYAVGVAGMVLKESFAHTKDHSNPDISPPTKGKPDIVVNHSHNSSFLGDMDVMQSPMGQKEFTVIDVKVVFLQVKATMAADPPLLLQIYSLEAMRHRWSQPAAKATLIRLYAQAPKLHKVWARILTTKHARIDLREVRRKQGTETFEEKSVDISTDAIRLGVPHQMVMHRIFDNCINVVKATAQLHHRFKTGSNEYILKKAAEGPKHIPKINIRSNALAFEIEDGAFEWKLSTIYRTGLTEQKQRLARDEAFKAKVKKIRDAEGPKGQARRARSSHPAGKKAGVPSGGTRARSSSNEERGRKRSSEAGQMRYNPDGVCGISDHAKITILEAEVRLKEHNSLSWKRRIDSAMTYQKNKMKDIRNFFWGPDDIPEDLGEKELILELPKRPSLMATLISDLRITIDKPSFGMDGYAKFLHDIGKGVPMDTKYSLLVPMNIKIDMGEARVNLRDYPLPLLHIPGMKVGQSSKTPGWSLKTDFVIAEELRDDQSIRHVRVDIISPDRSGNALERPGFAIDVQRTVSPVKTYSDVNVDINSPFATRITWGTSYQPAIQDMMQVIEQFTKTQVDPSDRVGFWDKIRLVFHSRLNVAWRGDGDVHLMLKGSRDPYVVTGHGAGFVMCWRNDVRLKICQDTDPRKFMIVDSGEYVLAVPDFSSQARAAAKSSKNDDDRSTLSSSSYKNGALFKKVIMKLSGNVRWMAGLMFERNLDDGGRTFDFKPHYEITLKSPEHALAPKGEIYDAYRGFRSHHIHLSVAVVAPQDRDWSTSNIKPSSSYNTVHLSPRFFTHFFSWWSMFSGAMSIPIRQGSLWPGVEKSSKKFGRHLATIKYSLLMSPLFISHIYKHKDAEDYTEDVVSATGLKVRLDSFMLDIHQRREEFETQVKGRKELTKTTGMRINQAELDFVSADIRAVSASIAGTTAEDLQKASEETLASYQVPAITADMSKFTIPDNDFTWIDMDDFVELDWILPSESNPETKIMPLAFAPRFTYFRQTDHQPAKEAKGETTKKSSPFGNEASHHCIMSTGNDPLQVQRDIIVERLRTLEEQNSENHRLVGEAELKMLKDEQNASFREEYIELAGHADTLDRKRRFLEEMERRVAKKVSKGDAVEDLVGVQDPENEQQDPRNDKYSAYSTPISDDDVESRMDPNWEGMDSGAIPDLSSDFNNRFIVHNMQLKWNNSLRNIILRYIHQVSQRRGFVYYTSRRAVKFILDIVDEQSKVKDTANTEQVTPSSNEDSSASSRKSTRIFDGDPDLDIQDRIKELLNDAKKFVNADDEDDEHHDNPERSGSPRGCPKATTGNMGDNISRDYTPQNSYHVRLIAPQIQMQSEKNTKAAVLVTAKGMQLKVVQIMDKDRVADDVSGLVQRRFSVDMDSVQFFVTNQKVAAQALAIFSGSKYGAPAGSLWPPWVPLENMFNFRVSPIGFSRVVQKTSASLRYDKYNSLRLKYNDEVSNDDDGLSARPLTAERRIDHLWVDFPEIKASCDSNQYYAIYIIVLDLLLYSEPLEKVRTERLEKIMLASDFSDLRGAPEMVMVLQERIRQLEEIKINFHINSKYLDRQGWEDRLSIESDLATCEDELFFMMKAITTAQQNYADRSSQTTGNLRWNLSSSQIVWHLMRVENEPLAEFQLKNAAYERTDNNDGSNYNTMQIDRITGLNLMKDALYPEMITPYLDNTAHVTDGRDTKMFRVNWNMLEAIAGIPVMDHFEVNLFPLKIQLEREVGKKLFEYVFPGKGEEGNGNENNASPFMVKYRPPNQNGDANSDEELPSPADTRTSVDYAESTSTGSLEARLRPTTNFAPSTRSGNSHSEGSQHHYLLPFKARNALRSNSTMSTPTKKASSESLKGGIRKKSDRSFTNLTSLAPNSTLSNEDKDKPRRLGIIRSSTKDIAEKPSDDLTQMMARASNYMTLAYVKIPSVVLCLSYKGKGERNIEDVHNLVFRMPIVEYRNKTWSNLDLAMNLKKDVIKALLSHTGAIIGNKFSHKRPSKQQQSRLREMANNSSSIHSEDTPYSTNDNSQMSLNTASPLISNGSEPRSSMATGRSSMFQRTNSYGSSIQSSTQHTGPGSVYESSLMTEKQGADNEDNKSFSMNNTLSRHLSGLAQMARHKTGIADDTEERYAFYAQSKRSAS
jgi:Mitochondrial protein from FMP27/Golgi-body localisation protein domain/RNA pol II promoter Fmp27 protein domain/Domain of unknown function (DUF2405)